MKKRFIRHALLLLVGLFMGWGWVTPGSAVEGPQGLKISRWDLREGYAYQYKNNSRPNNFQLISLFPSALIPLSDPMGPSWFHGHFDWNPELSLALFTHPYTRPLIGATPIQFHWQWETPGRFKPYLLIGAGILVAHVNRRETRSDLNFNLQGGVGTYISLNENTALILEYRHTHVSNAGLHEDNAGMNTHGFLAGASFKN